MADSVHILSLPLIWHIKGKLISSGFSSVNDFRDFLDCEKLKQQLNIEDKEADHILNIVQHYAFKNEQAFKFFHSQCGVSEAHLSENVTFESVAYLLRTKLQKVQHIVSFSSDVDKVLGGGFPLGRITEIAGGAGSGKTQFCFQLCVDVQIPDSLGGVGAEAVFLDAEGTFFPQRVEQIAKAAVQHCYQIADNSGNRDCVVSLKDFTVENVMSHIYMFRCRNSVQLLAASHQMKEFLRLHSKVKLLVVDSVAQCFRGEDDLRCRSKFLLTLGKTLHDIAKDFHLSVVITNQIATKIEDGRPEYNVPALGLRWSHFASVKLMLHKIGSTRLLYQYKSPSSVDGKAEFCISLDGIRDSHSAKMIKELMKSSTARTFDASDVGLYPSPSVKLDGTALGTSLPCVRNTCISRESMPPITREWIELSRKQKSSEATDAETVLGDSNVTEGGGGNSKSRKLPIASCIELSDCTSAAQKLPTEVSMETVAMTLRQSVDAMLSSDQPNKPPPMKKRKVDQTSYS